MLNTQKMLFIAEFRYYPEYTIPYLFCFVNGFSLFCLDFFVLCLICVVLSAQKTKLQLQNKAYVLDLNLKNHICSIFVDSLVVFLLDLCEFLYI